MVACRARIRYPKTRVAASRTPAMPPTPLAKRRFLLVRCRRPPCRFGWSTPTAWQGFHPTWRHRQWPAARDAAITRDPLPRAVANRSRSADQGRAPDGPVGGLGGAVPLATGAARSATRASARSDRSTRRAVIRPGGDEPAPLARAMPDEIDLLRHDPAHQVEIAMGSCGRSSFIWTRSASRSHHEAAPGPQECQDGSPRRGRATPSSRPRLGSATVEARQEIAPGTLLDAAPGRSDRADAITRPPPAAVA
jgi:hypothetical protein